MQIPSLKRITFSPTGTTKKILGCITQGIGVAAVEDLDLTLPEAAGRGPWEFRDELVLIGTPVYAGRVPPLAVERLGKVRGNRTPTVLVVTYGNRAFEDALLELRNLAREAGLVPVAAGAFIGEHSFSTEEVPLGAGRPDARDMEKARVFGEALMGKLATVSEVETLPALKVPGNYPYREGMQPSPVCARTEESLCVLCGTCASVCPAGAVEVGERVETQGLRCILCCACAKNCPTGARLMDAAHVQKIRGWLKENFTERREPEFFL